MINDEELMRRTAGGELAAFNEIVLRYEDTAWRLASRFLDDPSNAQDAAQEAFIRIFEAAARYRPTASFSTYLYRVLVRICMDANRKRREVPSDTTDEYTCPDLNPAQQMSKRNNEKKFQDALRKLPSRQRTAIILREFMELSYVDIADIMHTSTKSVERLLARARDALHRELKKN